MHELPSFEEAKVEVRTTADGSPTLYVPALNEHYHSTHGARQESEHVFIAAGLAPLLAAGGTTNAQPLRVLEVGLGTGLNAILTLEANQGVPTESFLEYDGLETFPLPPAVVAALRPEWDQRGEWLGRHFAYLHAAPWDVPVEMTPWFTVWKRSQPLQTVALRPGHYHLIYFDAFAPDKRGCTSELLRARPVPAQPAGRRLADGEAAGPPRQARDDAGPQAVVADYPLTWLLCPPIRPWPFTARAATGSPMAARTGSAPAAACGTPSRRRPCARAASAAGARWLRGRVAARGLVPRPGYGGGRANGNGPGRAGKCMLQPQ
jgi:hypothetical protein